MMTYRFMATALAVLFAALMVGAQESQVTVDEVVDKANHMAYYQGKDGRARVKMTIVDAQGRTRTKEFTILRRDVEEGDDGAQKFYVYFHEPADERGTVFMVHKHIGKDDDRWLYLPALDVVKRIAASDERTSFVGSHFFYEDVSGRGTEEDEHELVNTTDKFYVLKNTPKKPDSVEFDSFTMYIHKETFLPIQIEFEKGGNVYRKAITKKVDKVQDYLTVLQGEMHDDKIGGHTVLEYTDVEYDIGLPDDIFTERYLRKPPMEYLKK